MRPTFIRKHKNLERIRDTVEKKVKRSRSQGVKGECQELS